MKDRVECLRKIFLDTIINIDIEDLASSLPTPTYSNFSSLMKNIISKLNSEINKHKKLIKTCKEPEKIKEYEFEIKKIKQKVKICEDVYRNQYRVKN